MDIKFVRAKSICAISGGLHNIMRNSNNSMNYYAKVLILYVNLLDERTSFPPPFPVKIFRGDSKLFSQRKTLSGFTILTMMP